MHHPMRMPTNVSGQPPAPAPLVGQVPPSPTNVPAGGPVPHHQASQMPPPPATPMSGVSFYYSVLNATGLSVV